MPLTNITFDYMCIVDLEENREPWASDLRELNALCTRIGITPAVYTYAELENPKHGETYADRANLKTRLEALGLGHIELKSKQTLFFNDVGMDPMSFGPEMYLWNGVG